MQVNIVYLSSFLFWFLLRIKQLRNIEEEWSNSVGKINLRDFVGHELLLLPDLNLCHGCLLRLTKSNGTTGHTRILLRTQIDNEFI